MTARMTFRPESCSNAAAEACRALAAGRVVERILRRDHTLWKPGPREISDRLGWLDSPRTMRGRVAEIESVVGGIRADGLKFALLLGMGGSSLAPEVFGKVFGRRDGFLELAVLDSTDPGAVLARAGALDWRRTLFVVSTKSGGTVETFSLMKYFYNEALGRLGAQEAGRRFVAVTDPGSELARLAEQHHFRHVFLNDPTIGGRYSALSCFGLVPAALIGIDVARLLDRAAAVAEAEADPARQPADGPLLGALLGEYAARGRDKLTFLIPEPLAAFGDWLEQLLAESLGKEGEGILPVIGEEPAPPRLYGADRIFCAIRVAGDRSGEDWLAALAAAGHPVVDLWLEEPGDLGGHCYLWEIATAVAGWRLAVNPFDQPDVEAAKVLARGAVARYRENGALPDEAPALAGPAFAVYGESGARQPEAALAAFLAGAGPDRYVALQAFLTPGPETWEALSRLRMRIRDRFRVATTVGYGPRFLHSTGQLHKGDAGCGLFVQLTADDPADVPIPDALGQPGSTLTFGVLKQAQAAGDRQALVDAGRSVLRIHLRGNPPEGLRELAATL